MSLIDLSQTFRIADAVDIAFVAILIYVVLSWVQVRAARSIAFPLLGVVAVYWLAQWLDLYLTTSVFQFGLIGIFLAFVLVFQQDIRREFERLTTRRPTPRETEGADALVDLVVEGVGQLAEKRIGALLVCPGREPIERHVRGGVRVDAEISRPLLHSIFHPASPGHDGAVVLRGGRIDSLGLHLPLSSDLSQFPHGGTRHAAALGLAERCDALVVVVSEERGSISTAEDGALREVKLEQLVKQLKRHAWIAPVRQRDQVPAKERLRKAGLQLLSILVAGILWLAFASHTETIQRTIVVPIEYRGLSEGLIVDNLDVTYAQIALQGSEQTFDTLEVARVAVSIDLDGAEPGQRWYQMTKESLKGLPGELRVLEIQPRQIPLQIRTGAPPTTNQPPKRSSGPSS